MLKKSQQKLTRVATYLKSAKSKKKFFVHSITTSNPLKDLELEDLQAIAQVTDIEDYGSISRDELLSIIFPSKKAKKR